MKFNPRVAPATCPCWRATVSVYRSGGRPACRGSGHPARRIVARATPSLPRSECTFRAARCRLQPRWPPLQRYSYKGTV